MIRCSLSLFGDELNFLLTCNSKRNNIINNAAIPGFHKRFIAVCNQNAAQPHFLDQQQHNKEKEEVKL
jgi:hypothetical protein